MIARLVAAAAAGLFALTLASAWHDDVPVLLRLAAIGLAAVAVARPVVALAVTAALAPMATPIGAATGAAIPYAGILQLLVLPTLIGGALRAAATPAPAPGRLFWPCVGMAAVVGGVAAVQLAVLQYATSFPAPFLSELWGHLTRGHLAAPRELAPMHDAVLWLQALALAALAERLLRTSASARRTILLAAAAGMTAAAAMAAVRVAEVSIRNPTPWRTAWEVLRTVRFSTHFGDLNAAGSLFALWFVPLAWWARHGVSRALVVFSLPLVGLALWTTGSRSALAAAVVGVGLAWILTSRPALRRLVVTLALIAPLAWLATFNPGRDQAAARDALTIRAGLARLGLSMAADAPVFGHGFGGFRRESRVRAPDDLRARFPAFVQGENAHNNYLQVLVDFGGVGLGVFAWLLAAALWPWMHAVRAGPIGALPAGLIGGVCAFLVTCLAGHPLLIPQVLVPFGLALGLVAGLGPEAGRHGTRAGARVALAMGVLIAVSVVPRAMDLRATSRLEGQIVGGVPVEGAEGWRRVEDRIRWFVSSQASVVVMDLQSAGIGDDCVAQVSTDGEPAGSGYALGPTATRVRVALGPADASRASRRIDLRVTGAGCAALVGPIDARSGT